MEQTPSPARRGLPLIVLAIAAAVFTLLSACKSQSEPVGLAEPVSTSSVPRADRSETGDDTEANAPEAEAEELIERGDDVIPTATAAPESEPEPEPTPTPPAADEERGNDVSPAPASPTPTSTPPPTPTPSPTVVEISVPQGEEGELGSNSAPGVAHTPVREWDHALEGSDDQVYVLRNELLTIEDPSQTHLMYLALTGIRLGEAVDGDQLDAIIELTDPAADQTEWADGYAELVETTAVLAFNANLIEYDFDYAIDSDLLPFTHRFDPELIEIPELFEVPDGGLQRAPNAIDDGTP